MLCENCGGLLVYANGFYVCGNCGNKYSPTAFYEDIDTYICYVESDDAGRRTKDSILAQDIYQTLERSHIKTFYARISGDKAMGSDLERVCNAALHNSKTVILLGTQKCFFELLVEKYSDFFAGKIIIPVYADMDAYDIPNRISEIQALDYNKVGAAIDLTKSIYNALEREQVPDYSALHRKYSTKIKWALWISVAVFMIVVLGISIYYLMLNATRENDFVQATLPTTESTPAILNAEDIQQDQYIEAVTCMEAHDYVKAIDLFSGLLGYNDSEKRLNVIYQRYAGYYQNKDQDVTFHLQIWEGNAGAIELSRTTSGGARCKISESFQLQGELQSFTFNDSENNQGKLILQLSNDGLFISVATTNVVSSISIGNFEEKFLLAEKADKPFAEEVSTDTIKKWLSVRTTESELKTLGHELVFEDALYKDTVASQYGIKNTDIKIALFGSGAFSPNAGYDEETIAGECKVALGFSVPASIIIPDKIGESALPFVEDDVLYFPNGKMTQSYIPLLFYEEDEGENIITKDMAICCTSKALLSDEHWNELLKECVYGLRIQKEALRTYGNEITTVFSIYAEAENDTHYLYSAVAWRDNLAFLYKINKESLKIDYVSEVYCDFQDYEVYWKDQSELVSEFPLDLDLV